MPAKNVKQQEKDYGCNIDQEMNFIAKEKFFYVACSIVWK